MVFESMVKKISQKKINVTFFFWFTNRSYIKLEVSFGQKKRRNIQTNGYVLYHVNLSKNKYKNKQKNIIITTVHKTSFLL